MSESLRQRLIADQRERGYPAVRVEFENRDPSEAYAALFPIAVQYGSDGGDAIAAQLLVEVEPLCPVTCEDALITVATANWWQISDERVPFYLLCQFGRRELFASIERLLSSGRLDAKRAQIVDGVGYWARLRGRGHEAISDIPFIRRVGKLRGIAMDGAMCDRAGR